MKYEINKGERILTAWLINNIKGVNRTDARLITKVYEHLDLGEVQGAVPLKDLKKLFAVDLADLEVKWITDHINKAFDKQEIPPSLASYTLSLEDKLKIEDTEDMDKE